jgi:CheY-like chemotaxis protein
MAAVNQALVRCLGSVCAGSTIPDDPTKVLFHEGHDPVHAGVGVGAIVTAIRPETICFLTTGTKSVLILVEDDLSVLRALRRLMISAGFRVIAFDRPRAVLDSELPKTDACLVVDVHLPEMNGVQLCERLAAAGCRLPVIMMTGHIDPATRELVCRAKIVAILFKPFTRDSLLGAISEALAIGKST